jgi:uncharacterized protein with gpF-like domain
VQFDLSALARRAKNVRRSSITLRDIAPPAVLATNLYQSSYAPVIALWRRYAERITAEYERSLSALTTDAPSDINATLAAADAELQRLLLTLTPALRQWVLSVENWQRGKWRGAVLSATGVDLGTLIGPEDAQQTLEQILEWNTNLVVDVSTQTRQRISNAAFSGLTNRTPAREVAKQISEATGMARDRSLRIASDQLSKLTSALADERRRAAGISTWEWVHSRKLHPRAAHVAHNGHIYSDDPADVGKVVDGKTVETPPATRPGQEPYCGCRSRSVLVFT